MTGNKGEKHYTEAKGTLSKTVIKRGFFFKNRMPGFNGRTISLFDRYNMILGAMRRVYVFGEGHIQKADTCA